MNIATILLLLQLASSLILQVQKNPSIDSEFRNMAIKTASQAIVLAQNSVLELQMQEQKKQEIPIQKSIAPVPIIPVKESLKLIEDMKVSISYEDYGVKVFFTIKANRPFRVDTYFFGREKLVPFLDSDTQYLSSHSFFEVFAPHQAVPVRLRIYDQSGDYIWVEKIIDIQ